MGEEKTSGDGFKRGMALVIGVSAYEKPGLALPQAIVNDATDLANLLGDKAFCGYPASRITTLTNRRASLTGIRDGLSWLKETAKPQDTVVIMFSGHGFTLEGEGLFCPVEFDAADPANTGLREAEFSAALRDITAERILVLLDACHAAALAQVKGFGGGARKIEAGLAEGIYARLQAGRGRVVIAAALAHQASYVAPDARNSVFTGALLDGLRGAVPARDGMIYVDALFEYVAATVRALGRQNPYRQSAGEGDFAIALAPPAPPPPAGQRPEVDPNWREPALYALRNLGVEAWAARNRPDGENTVALVRLANQKGLQPHERQIYLEAAAALRSAEACFHLGLAAWREKTLPRSLANAERWWREGAALNDVACMFRLSELLRSVPGGAAESASFLNRSAERGYPPARFRVAASQVGSADPADREAGRRSLRGIADDASIDPSIRAHAAEVLRARDGK